MNPYAYVNKYPEIFQNTLKISIAILQMKTASAQRLKTEQWSSSAMTPNFDVSLGFSKLWVSNNNHTV